MFFGSIPALVTPFSGGRVAEDTFARVRRLADRAKDRNALVPCGTTGESRDPDSRRASPGDRSDGPRRRRAECR